MTQSVEYLSDYYGQLVTAFNVIQAKVIAVTGIPAELFHSRRRDRYALFPRMTAMCITCELTDATLTQIGHHYQRDHVTVINARRTITNLCDTEPDFAKRYAEIKAACAAAIEAEEDGRINP